MWLVYTCLSLAHARGGKNVSASGSIELSDSVDCSMSESEEDFYSLPSTSDSNKKKLCTSEAYYGVSHDIIFKYAIDL